MVEIGEEKGGQGRGWMGWECGRDRRNDGVRDSGGVSEVELCETSEER